MRAEQGGRVSASICLEIGWLERFFSSGRLDDFLESSRAPSGLHQVDSALGGSIGRDVSSDGGGAAHLLSEGVFFGRERKSHRRRG